MSLLPLYSGRLRSTGAGVTLVAVLAIIVSCGSTGGGTSDTISPGAATPTTANREGVVFSFDGYGAITIGMTKPEVFRASRVPLAVYGNNNCIWLYDKKVADVNGNPARTAQITLDNRGIVRHIDIYSSRDARTDRGVGAGSTLAEVLAAYPEPHKRMMTQAADVLVVSGTKSDLSFALDKSDRVVGIAIGYRGYAMGFEDCSG